MTSSTYVYTYIAFALAYIGSSLLLVVHAFKTSGLLSSAGRNARRDGRPTFELARTFVAHGQRVVDYTQLATLLPLLYIVLSVGLGSAILRDRAWAGVANAAWIVITLLGIGTCMLLVGRTIKEAHALAEMDATTAVTGERTADAASRLGGRLGMSAGLLVLVLVFTALNLWAVASNISTMLGLDYVL